MNLIGELSICTIVFFFAANMNCWKRYDDMDVVVVTPEEVRRFITNIIKSLFICLFVLDASGSSKQSIHLVLPVG